LFIFGISKVCRTKSATCFGISSKKLESIIYYERFVVIQPGILDEKGKKQGDLLTEEEYLDILDTLPKENQYLP